MAQQHQTRAIVHVDLDAFYVQVERHLDPTLNNIPCAVVQYNSWQGGGIIALSYEAKDAGVKRSMRGDQAKKICPNIRLVSVRVKNDKADLENYRVAGTHVFETCAELGAVCERTSIDEAYLDVTDLASQLLHQARTHPTTLPSPLLAHDTNIIALESKPQRDQWLQALCTASSTVADADLLLVAASAVVQQLRDRVHQKTGYTLSAGIAHNKTLSKMISGRFKPNKQTMLRQRDVQTILATLPLRELNGFGGKLGDGLLGRFQLKHVGDLTQYTLTKLTQMAKFCNGGSEEASINTAKWMYATCRGQVVLDNPKHRVTARLRATTIGCSKTFTGTEVLKGGGGRNHSFLDTVRHYLHDQATEIVSGGVAGLAGLFFVWGRWGGSGGSWGGRIVVN